LDGNWKQYITRNAIFNMRHLYTILLLSVFLWFLSCENEDGFQFDDVGVSSSGSIAKFSIDQNYLYVVEKNSLEIFDVSDQTQITSLGKLDLLQNIETIFRLDTIVYLGTTTGVLFIDISDPSTPFHISSYDHLTACDPVVANEQYAFATLRAGRNCGDAGNLLDIIDISDLSSPSLIKSYQMTSPYGLGLLGTNLFVGEKNNGMRWFDVSDVENIAELGYFPDIHAIDFIIKGNHITISTTESILQLELSTTNQLVKLSELMFENN